MSNMVRAPFYVYFMRDKKDGTIKIGFSADPDHRKESLSREWKVRLEVLGMVAGGRSEEKRIHTLFSRHQAKGEWFFPHQEIMDFILTECISLEQYLSLDRAERHLTKAQEIYAELSRYPGSSISDKLAFMNHFRALAQKELEKAQADAE